MEKKIFKITLKRELDELAGIPDHLGKFSDTKAAKFSIDRGESAVRNREFRYFNAENVENMKQARENYAIALKYNEGELVDYGVMAEAEIGTPSGASSYLCNHISSGGLWGISSDSGAEYFAETGQDQLHELKIVLRDLGFSDEVIAAAPVVNELDK